MKISNNITETVSKHLCRWFLFLGGKKVRGNRGIAHGNII